MTAVVGNALQRSPGPGGCSQTDPVWSRNKVTLYRYRPLVKPAGGVPLLIVYALVNRPYMMDLQPDKSMIRGLLTAGVDVYLVDWGRPDGADRCTSLADYIDDLLPACTQYILETHRITALNVLGVCQGGVFSLCFTALHPGLVRNLVTMVTPVDFHTPTNLLSRWVRKIDVAALCTGNVPGDVLNQAFLSLQPFRLRLQKYVELLRSNADGERLENFMRVERWLFDSPDQAATAFHEFLLWFYQENRLVNDQLYIGGRKVDLRAVRCPVLNLIGGRDHLVPPDASRALQRVVGTADYRAIEYDLGHIGMYVSTRAQRQVTPAIAQWLAAR